MPSEGSSPPPKNYLRAKLHRNPLAYDLGGVSCQSHGGDCPLQPQIPTGNRRRAKFQRAQRPKRLNRHRTGGTHNHSEGSVTDFPGQARPLPPLRGRGRDRLSPPAAGLRSPPAAPLSPGSSPSGPCPPVILAPGGMSAPPPRRAALPGASDGRFMSGERDAGPAAACSPCPACRAPPGSGGSCGTPGARQRLRCAPPRTQAALARCPREWSWGPELGTGGGGAGKAGDSQSQWRHSGFLSPPAYALPVSPVAQHPTRLRAARPDALPGASAAAGRSRRCPGEERPGASAPPLAARAAAAPPRPAPAPPQPPPAAARLRRPGGLCPCAEPRTARPQPGAESPGKPLLRGSSLEMHRNSPRAEMEPRGVPKARINVKGVALALRNPPPVIKWSNPTEGPY